MKPSSSPAAAPAAAIAPDVALRALAIASVVVNHAAAVARPFELGGGLNVLLLLTGYSFARFALISGSPARMRASAVRFSLNLALPCLAIVLLSFAARRQFAWDELLFVSNLWRIDHISPLFIWYPQAMVQVMAIFWLASFAPGTGRAFTRTPLLASLGALAAAMILYLVVHWLLLGSTVERRPPHVLMWNLVFGWVVFFALHGPYPLGRSGRLALIVLAGGLAWLVFGWGDDWLRAVAFTGAVAAMLLVGRIPLPSTVLVRGTTIVSQAAFTIFLFHAIVLRTLDALHLRRSPGRFDPGDVMIAATVTLVACVAVWIVLASFTRAWRYGLSDRGWPVASRPSGLGAMHPAWSRS